MYMIIIVKNYFGMILNNKDKNKVDFFSFKI